MEGRLNHSRSFFNVGDYVQLNYSGYPYTYAWKEQVYPIMPNEVIERLPSNEVCIVMAVFVKQYYDFSYLSYRYDYIYLVCQLLTNRIYLVEEDYLRSVPAEVSSRLMEELPDIPPKLQTAIDFMHERMSAFGDFPLKPSDKEDEIVEFK